MWLIVTTRAAQGRWGKTDLRSCFRECRGWFGGRAEEGGRLGFVGSYAHAGKGANTVGP
jgi:hypothetical protein